MTRTTLSLACTLLAAGAMAQAQAPAIRAVRAASTPVIDGKLDDACWLAAKPATGFLGINSRTPATHQSIGYVTYDDSHLYIAAKCLDPNTKSIRAEPRPHDDNVFNDDIVEIMLDPMRSRSDYYQLVVSAVGATFDSFRHGGGNAVDESWDGAWRAKSFIGPDYWSAEVAIELACLGLAPGVASTWGFNLCREKAKPKELSSLGINGAFNEAGRFRALSGLDVDFSRFFFSIGPPGAALKRVDGRLCGVVTVPVVNRTGRDRSVRIGWQSPSSPGREKSVQLRAGGSHAIALEPGRLYSLKLYTGDYQNLIRGLTVKESNAVSIAIEGGECLPDQSFQSPFHSCFAAGAFTRTKRAWLNYHWRVFQATAPTGKLVISD